MVGGRFLTETTLGKPSELLRPTVCWWKCKVSSLDNCIQIDATDINSSWLHFNRAVS